MWRSWGIIITVSIFATFSEFYIHRITLPYCHPVGAGPTLPSHFQVVDSSNSPSQDLTAIFVSNLLLQGSNSSLYDVFFRDFFLSHFFKKSYESLKPDMLLVLGDVSERGYQSTRKEWSSVVQQFHRVIGPFVDLPFHVTLGDRDIGECSTLKVGLIHRAARSFPELSNGGCGSFEMSNVSFISLNAMALLCGNSEFLLDVETLIERESAYLRTRTEHDKREVVKLNAESDASNEYGWRENPASSQSGPVLLLHFPLQQVSRKSCRQESKPSTVWNSLSESLKLLWRRQANSGPYDLMHTVPPNATEYIFQALKPRIVFSAHSHEFCDSIHPDGTREVTIPAMAWKAKDDPGFVVATFKSNGAITVRFCSLPSEFRVVVSLISIFVLSISPAIVTHLLYQLNLKQNR